MTSTPANALYRYENRYDVVRLETYAIVKRTARGVWILDHYSLKQKFVLNPEPGCGKRFAWPTEAEAKTSFFARKHRQLAILRSQITQVEAAVEALKEGRMNDYRSSLYFD